MEQITSLDGTPLDVKKESSRDARHFYIQNKQVTEEEWNQKQL